MNTAMGWSLGLARSTVHYILMNTIDNNIGLLWISSPYSITGFYCNNNSSVCIVYFYIF